MSLSGSIPLLFYFGVRFLFKEHCEAKKLMLLLNFSVIFFILPTPALSSLVRDHIPFIINEKKLGDIKWIPEKTIFVSNNKLSIKLPNYSRIFYIVTFIWVIIFTILFIRMFYFYRKFKKTLKQSSYYNNTITIKTLFLKRKVNIRIGNSDNVKPYSTGFLHPIVVFPPQLHNDEKQLILLHEISHIQHMDFLVRYIALFIQSLHWFNPFAYLLLREIKKLQEFRTDEQVMSQLDEQAQLKYGALVLNAVTEHQAINIKTENYISPFYSSPYQITKERILRLKNMIKKAKIKKLSILIISTFAFLGSCLTIAAYNAPTTVIGSDVAKESKDLTLVTKPNPILDFSESNEYFTDDHGVRTSITSTGDQKTICLHTWKSGALEYHRKNSDGSCDIITYSAKICIKCGSTKKGEEISTLHYNKCPH